MRDASRNGGKAEKYIVYRTGSPQLGTESPPSNGVVVLKASYLVPAGV
jgi:hypothetical protein